MHKYCGSMADELRQVNLDSRQIRVLAHPLRARLLAQLRVNGPATATRLAEVLGTNTGATSYHLRQLAEIGLVTEDHDAGRGRERWWRSAHDVSSWHRDEYADDPDAMAAADWLNSYSAQRLAERIEEWHRDAADESAEWRQAADFSDYILQLSAAQLVAMTQELDTVIERWRRTTGATPDPDARKVRLYLYGLPVKEEGES
jgi:predicted ArsR family transcriptional regulator